MYAATIALPGGAKATNSLFMREEPSRPRYVRMAEDEALATVSLGERPSCASQNAAKSAAEPRADTSRMVACDAPGRTVESFAKRVERTATLVSLPLFNCCREAVPIMK